MAVFILASYIPTNYKDQLGVRHPIAIVGHNGIVDTIKKFLPSHHRFVFVANDPEHYDKNDIKSEVTFQSFAMSGVEFDEYILLDNRNKSDANEILAGADFILLAGGKIPCQNNFLKEIKIKKVLKNSQALVLGVSAGAMNLCNKIFNFPEELIDINEPRIIEGLGYYNNYIVPHFDGRNMSYFCEEINTINEYILPFSERETLVGINNDSYIILHNNNVEFVGEYCLIKDRRVELYNTEYKP